MALITTAIIPASDFTIPVRAIWSTARHRLPVLHPEPPIPRFTTGLRNGSRRPPAILIVLCSFFGSTGFFLSSTAASGFGGLGLFTTTEVVFFFVFFVLLAWVLAAAVEETAAVCGLEDCAPDPACAWAALTSFPEAGLAGTVADCDAAKAASESAVFCCSTTVSLAFVFSMTLGFCAPAVPSPIVMMRIPVA